ncbi:hypothetical protein JHK87_002652 [Glycine soja]|nr:hypothetical protein JHK87_002652 [Glycine soja]
MNNAKRLKPKNSEFKIDLAIDLESDNIDKEFANKYNTTKQTFSTLWKPYDSPYDTNEYAVGLLMDDKNKQTEPSVIDQQSKRVMRLSVFEESSPIVPFVYPVQCWFPLKYHSYKSDISSRYLQQMVAEESSPINFTMRA